MRPHPLTEDDPYAIGGHRLLARLGSGGMGTVYLARTPKGRTVALKAVHPALAADPESVTRFQRETETVRALCDLEHVPPYVGAGTDHGRPWLATAYVLGPSLTEAVTAHGPWPEASVRALGAQLAKALAALHAGGVVHRDLKPSNILLTPSGPRLVDFGIAQTDDPGHRTGASPGTPAYMAPEQLADARVGPACDVYALASVLTYTACARPPFGEGEPGEVLYRITHEEPELAAVPDGLRPLLTECLRRNPSSRPTVATVSELMGARGWFGDRLPATVLTDIADRTARAGEAPPPRVTSAPPIASRLTRRRLLTGAAAVAVVGAGGTIWATRGTGPDDSATGRTTPTPAPSRSRDRTERPGAVWEYRANFNQSGLTKGAMLIDGTIMIPDDDDRFVYGIDARTGTLRWTADDDHSFGFLTACGPVAVSRVIEQGGRLAGRESADGRGWLTAPLDVSFDLLFQPVFAADGRTVYAVGHDPAAGQDDEPAQHDRHLLAYDITDRRLRWRRPLRRSAATAVVGAVADGVLVLLENDEVVAHRAATGAPLWTRALSTTTLDRQYNGLTERTVAAASGTAVIAGRGVLCLDLPTGRTLWSLDPEDTGTSGKGRVLHGGTTIDGTTIYLSVLGKDLAVVQRDDRTKGWSWKRNLTLMDTPAPPPLLAGGYVFPQMGGASVEDATAVDLRTHKTAWTIKTVDSEADDVQLLSDGHTLYILRGTRLRAYPLT